ncbi:Uncharacterised protein r2_g733 [Pycnogonum litorale]
MSFKILFVWLFKVCLSNVSSVLRDFISIFGVKFRQTGNGVKRSPDNAPGQNLLGQIILNFDLLLLLPVSDHRHRVDYPVTVWCDSISLMVCSLCALCQHIKYYIMGQQ